MVTVEKLASITAKVEDTIHNAPPALPVQPQPSLPSKPTYTSTVMRMLPPSHTTSLARQDAQFHQVLIDIRGDNSGGETNGLTATEYISKATVALDLMCADGHPPPNGLRFLTVWGLRHGGLLYKVNTKDGATWLQQPDNMQHFTEKFGHDAVIRAKNFACLARNTPVSINLDREQTLRNLATWNGWTKGEVIAAHWIKPIAKHRTGQERAHMILKLSTPQRANSAIMNGMSILGQRLPIEKLRKEARRCLHCQKLEPGHLAHDCEMIEDVCGTCAGLHSTQSCTEPTRQCVNCADGHHASWDHKCPAFLEATHKVQQANTLEQYRFFPLTDDPDAWEHLNVPPFPTTQRGHLVPSQREPYASEPFLWSDDPSPHAWGGRNPPPHDRYGCSRRSRSHSRHYHSRSPVFDDRALANGANRIPLDPQRDPYAHASNPRPRTWSLRSTTSQRQTMLTPDGGIRPIPSCPHSPSVSRTPART